MKEYPYLGYEAQAYKNGWWEGFFMGCVICIGVPSVVFTLYRLLLA